MRQVDGFRLANAAAGTSTFQLSGGMYAVAFKGTGAGTVDVKAIGPDGTTAIACGVTQIVATTGFQSGINLPPGQYQVIVAGFTANYFAMTRVPGE